MDKKQLDDLIQLTESHVECWKQFNGFLALARAKKSTPEDEEQFLELKSVLTQELELIMSAVECENPSREEVHQLIGSVPSIRYLAELPESSIRTVENQWHKIYIGWQSILGQMKVKQREMEGRGGWSLFGGRKK